MKLTNLRHFIYTDSCTLCPYLTGHNVMKINLRFSMCRISFLLKARSYSVIWGHILLVRLDAWVTSTFWLLWTWMDQYLLAFLPSVPLAMCPDVGMLGIMVIPWLIFWEGALPFSTVAASLTFPPAVHKGSRLSTASPTLAIIIFCNSFTLMWVKCYLTVVLACVFLMIGDSEHLFVCHSAICRFFFFF